MKTLRITALLVAMASSSFATYTTTAAPIAKPNTTGIDEWGQSQSAIVKEYHRLFKREISKVWFPPRDAKGAFVKVKFYANNDGSVKNMKIETINDQLRLSMQAAINTAQPFPLPINKDTKRMVRKFEGTFFVQ